LHAPLPEVAKAGRSFPTRNTLFALAL
jgi:hypothetical protein